IFHGPQVDTHLPFHSSRPMHGRFVTGNHQGIGHMIISTHDASESYAFYKKLGMRGSIEYLFGGRSNRNQGEVTFMHCNERDHSIAFGGSIPLNGKHINHLMIEVDNLDDVFMTYELVEASKYPVTISLGKHANDNMFSFYFATPSGWAIEIGFAGRPATHQSEYYLRDTYGHRFVGPRS
ncbi:MAG: VOC family protein, partial [Pseudomonadota bacterium]